MQPFFGFLYYSFEEIVFSVPVLTIFSLLVIATFINSKFFAQQLKYYKKNRKLNIKPSIIFNAIKSFYAKHPIISILLIIFCVWAIVWLGQVSVERYKFYQAERKIDKLAADLQSRLGNEVTLKKERSCGYGSEKYGRGARSCLIRYGVEISPINTARATLLATKLKAAIEENVTFKDKKVEGNDLPFDSTPDEGGIRSQGFSIGLDEIKDKEPKCGTGATYLILSTRSKEVVPGSADTLTLSMTCYGSAKWEYFPVRD